MISWRNSLWRRRDRVLWFRVSSGNKPAPVFADPRECIALGDGVEDVVTHEPVTEEVGEGAKVVTTMETEDNVRICIMSRKFSAERS
jgi:hypothetical protein